VAEHMIQEILIYVHDSEHVLCLSQQCIKLNHTITHHQ